MPHDNWHWRAGPVEPGPTVVFDMDELVIVRTVKDDETFVFGRGSVDDQASNSDGFAPVKFKDIFLTRYKKVEEGASY